MSHKKKNKKSKPSVETYYLTLEEITNLVMAVLHELPHQEEEKEEKPSIVQHVTVPEKMETDYTIKVKPGEFLLNLKNDGDSDILVTLKKGSKLIPTTNFAFADDEEGRFDDLMEELPCNFIWRDCEE